MAYAMYSGIKYICDTRVQTNRLPLRGCSFFFITCMTTVRIGLHPVLLLTTNQQTYFASLASISGHATSAFKIIHKIYATSIILAWITGTIINV